MKNEGIINYNKNRPTAEKIGAQIRKNPEISCLVTCPKCCMSLTRKGLRYHVDKCSIEKESLVLTPGPTSALRRKIDSDFRILLNELNDDDIKSIIESSESLKEIGKTLLNAKMKEVEKEVSARQQTRKFLRDYANLYLVYQNKYGKCGFLDMFSSARGQYSKFSEAFAELTHDNQGKPIKSRIVRYYNSMKHIHDGAILLYTKGA